MIINHFKTAFISAINFTEHASLWFYTVYVIHTSILYLLYSFIMLWIVGGHTRVQKSDYGVWDGDTGKGHDVVGQLAPNVLLFFIPIRE